MEVKVGEVFYNNRTKKEFIVTGISKRINVLYKDGKVARKSFSAFENNRYTKKCTNVSLDITTLFGV